MIIYATKQTVDRYGMTMPENIQNPIIRPLVLKTYNNEKGDRLLEWGAKLFSLTIVNACKFVILQAN